MSRKGTFYLLYYAMATTETLRELADDAIAALEERQKDKERRCEMDASDHIHEIADDFVPIYYKQLLVMARYHVRLAVEQPEI